MIFQIQFIGFVIHFVYYFTHMAGITVGCQKMQSFGIKFFRQLKYLISCIELENAVRRKERFKSFGVNKPVVNALLYLIVFENSR